MQGHRDIPRQGSSRHHSNPVGGEQTRSCCPVQVKLRNAGGGSRMVLGQLGEKLQPNTKTSTPDTTEHWM